MNLVAHVHPVPAPSGAHTSMRFVVAVLLAVVCLLGRDKAAALTPDELLQSCEVVASAAPAVQRDMVDIPAAGLPCWYYMSAVQDMSVLSDEGEVQLLHFWTVRQ